ncbi:hypothetical protein B0H67DRAFT_598487 [Lasiosphaeris hirsuta]|uniref:Uncharacterized protein n=1 Tax=Lasiosphaeris hirsuta TaxID=260670 RepID=A0AA40E2Y8_9PEZI|nr:hypothetical protein B0H67DRAFT_598487 [Lasiosphaeris hirsuta]
MADSPFSTPKRKHAQLFNDDHDNSNLYTSTQFTFDPHSPLKDGSASPRTNVAHRFSGLDLGGGGGVSDPRPSQSPGPNMKSLPFSHVFGSLQIDARGDGARKRMKLLDGELPDADIPDLHVSVAARHDPTSPAYRSAGYATTTSRKSGSQSPRQRSPGAVKFALDTAVVEQSEKVANTGSSRSSRFQASPSLPKTSTDDTHKPLRGKRAGTPPLAYKPSPGAKPLMPAKSETDVVSSSSSPGSDDTFITDPLRASLTWHDDEITIYDPDDSDDDGTGINGIGFKPTPAIAHARTVKRKQQLAEYRKREEREARAKRSQRRRGSPVPGLVELKGTVERRKVRFMESATELLSF